MSSISLASSTGAYIDCAPTRFFEWWRLRQKHVIGIAKLSRAQLMLSTCLQDPFSCVMPPPAQSHRRHLRASALPAPARAHRFASSAKDTEQIDEGACDCARAADLISRIPSFPAGSGGEDVRTRCTAAAATNLARPMTALQGWAHALQKRIAVASAMHCRLQVPVLSETLQPVQPRACCVQGSGGAGLLQNAGLTVTLFLVICAFLAAAQLGGESVCAVQRTRQHNIGIV